MTETKVTQKLIDFENPLVKSLLARNLKINASNLKYFVMPTEGDTITLGNVIYRISYVRENPFRFTAIPIGILTNTELEEALKKATTGEKPSE